MIESPDFAEESEPAVDEHAESPQASPAENRESNSGEGRGGWRGRRRRRGRRGERMPESKFARPAADAPRESPREAPSRESSRPERPEYGPPPGYQPIMLPGESISKYQRLAKAQAASPGRYSESAFTSPQHQESAPPALTENFPEDEPLFARPGTREAEEKREDQYTEHVETKVAKLSERERAREDERLDNMNVAAVFGGPELERDEDQAREETDPGQAFGEEQSAQPALAAQANPAGTFEEEEIEEEEADLAHYVEDLEEDATFEELEEETRAAEDNREASGQQVAAVGEPAGEAVLPAEELSADVVEGEEVDEVAEEEEEEAEIEEAQAEAEAERESSGARWYPKWS